MLIFAGFQIGNQFIKFPEGSVLYEAESEQSGFGYWVISPEGTFPSEYRDENTAPPAETDYVYVNNANITKLKTKLTCIH